MPAAQGSSTLGSMIGPVYQSSLSTMNAAYQQVVNATVAYQAAAVALSVANVALATAQASVNSTNPNT